MAFELLYSLKGKKFWWIDILFYFFAALLILTIIFYFVLDIQISAQNHEIEKFSADIEKFGTPEQREIEKKVFNYQKKIKEVSGLAKEHKISSNFFKLIEENTFSEVYFPTVSLDVKGFKAELIGRTEDFENLSKQLILFEKNENIKNIKAFNSILDNDAKAIFNLTLLLSPELFLWK